DEDVKEDGTEVAQRVAPMLLEEAVLAMPALAVGGVEGVDVDVSPVAVEWSAVAGSAEAVDAAAAVREPAEEVAVLPVGPVLVHREDGEWATPVREVELGGACLATVVRLQARPGLECPVAAVGCLACLEQPGQRRPGVG